MIYCFYIISAIVMLTKHTSKLSERCIIINHKRYYV